MTKYKLVAFRADDTPIGEAEFPTILIDRTLVVQIPDNELTRADMHEQHQMLQQFFPNHYVMLISNSVRFFRLEPMGENTVGVSEEGAAWAMETQCDCRGLPGHAPGCAMYRGGE